MSRRVKVPMFRTTRPIEIDADATEGAVLGRNLRWPNGSLVNPKDLGQGAGAGDIRRLELAPGELQGSRLDGAGGNPFIGLADVHDAGGGSLQRTEFDSKGRKTGTSTATTDDLPEGLARLYHTEERSQDAVGSIMSNGGDVGLVYDPATKSISASINNSNLASIASVSAVDGGVLEYSPSGEWSATDSPRKLYLDGGNF